MNAIKVLKRAQPGRRTLLVLVASLVALTTVLVLGNRPQPTAAQAADGVRGYIYISGIPGESADPMHAGWCDVVSVEQGENRVDPSVSIVKPIDAASPLLEWAWATQKVIASVTVEFWKYHEAYGGMYCFYRIELKNVRLRAYVAQAESGGVSGEAFQMRFTKMRVTYRFGDGSHIETPWWRP